MRQRVHPKRVLIALTVLAAGLALLAPGAARAQVNYKIQPIVTIGDTIAGVPVRFAPTCNLLNDKGQLVLQVPIGTPGGALFVYADGTFTPLVLGGQDAPGGKWPKNVDVSELSGMNQRGNVAFEAQVTIEDKTSSGTFLWDAQTRKVTSVALAGMPAANNLTFLPSTTLVANPAINNLDEIVFGGHVADTAGKVRVASFCLGRDKTLRSVVLPDQDLPGGGTMLQFGGNLAVNDAGLVAFRARRPGDPGGAFSAYQWENGVLTPLALVGGDAPGGGKITQVSALRLNNRDRSVLLALRTSSQPTAGGLYRLAEGQLTPLAVPGQEMPGGGKLQRVLEEYGASVGANANGDVSQANEAGQHVFRARLEDGTRALYRLDPDGKLTLLLKQGMVTEQGEITALPGGLGIGFNSRGQIALTLAIAGGPRAFVLLMPTTP